MEKIRKVINVPYSFSIKIGRILPPLRIDTGLEHHQWKPFGKSLEKEGRKLFGEMFSLSKLCNSAC